MNFVLSFYQTQRQELCMQTHKGRETLAHVPTFKKLRERARRAEIEYPGIMLTSHMDNPESSTRTPYFEFITGVRLKYEWKKDTVPLARDIEVILMELVLGAYRKKDLKNLEKWSRKVLKSMRAVCREHDIEHAKLLGAHKMLH